VTDPAATPILAFENARISFFLRAGEANVIPGLSFSIAPREALGLVGESGCGKSTVALAIMRYLGRAGRLTAGRILFQGRDMAAFDDDALRAVRGRQIAMIYQDPMSSLNPVMTIGRQLMEVPMIHEGIDADAARERALAMLDEVKLPDAAAVALDDAALRNALEAQHLESYGWALSCCRRRRDEAENVLQLVYLKVLSGKAVFDGRSSFKTWLFAVIRKTAAHEFRMELLRRLRLSQLPKAIDAKHHSSRIRSRVRSRATGWRLLSARV